MIILFFFVGHWYLSLFMQTMFLHRYASHQMFTLTKFWERVFFFLTFIIQGSSFLNPRAYAILHRLHHSYSDTEKDPHSPRFSKNLFRMNKNTVVSYENILNNRVSHKNLEYNIPRWEALESFSEKWLVRLGFVFIYASIYYAYSTSIWQFLLVPIHAVMGPLHGSIVNWCGHRYGYKNFSKVKDDSKNTLPFDFITMGELFQNNHHNDPNNVKFSRKWFEVDPGYVIIYILNKLKIAKI